MTAQDVVAAAASGSDSFVATGGTALVSAILIQALKNSDWATWFNRQTPRANLFLSLVVAYATSVGIHLTYDPTKGELLVTGLTIAGMRHFVWEGLVQWATQHALYKKVVAEPEAAGETRALIQRLAQPPISDAERKTQEAVGASERKP